MVEGRFALCDWWTRTTWQTGLMRQDGGCWQRKGTQFCTVKKTWVNL